MANFASVVVFALAVHLIIILAQTARSTRKRGRDEHLAAGLCIVNIQTDLLSPEPVFFRNNNELWSPSGRYLKWNPGETTVISCQRGKLTGSDLSTVPITCQSGTNFLIRKTSVSLKSLNCTIRITGEVEETATPCGNGTGRLFNIGFRNPANRITGFMQSCYNMNTASVVYTRHVIDGKAIPYSIKESYRPAFNTTGTPSHIKVKSAYTQQSQKNRLSYLLGSPKKADHYLNASSFLARGHLTPRGDGIFRSWQWATFYYVNAAPQWQAVNNGNWKAVELATRKCAADLQENLLIFTGTHGVMRLKHVNGSQIPITLAKGGIEVPKWFWKIIISQRLDSGIAVITNNDPFRTSMPKNKMLCSDVCVGRKTEYNDFASGFTYCCTVASLMRAVPTIPPEAKVSNLLTCSKTKQTNKQSFLT